MTNSVLKKYYVTPKDIQALIPEASIGYCRKLAREIQKDMEKEGKTIIASKSILVPTKMVIERLGI